MNIIEVTNQNYDEVTKSGKILLDFWAEWCGPCRMLTPVLEKLAEEEDLTIGKINVDNEEELAEKFQIRSIPTLCLLNDGKIINKSVGYQTLEDLRNFVNGL